MCHESAECRGARSSVPPATKGLELALGAPPAETVSGSQEDIAQSW